MQIFMTSALVGGEGSASRPGRFTPGERAPRYPLYRRPSRSGRRWEEKILDYRDSNSDPSVVQPVASRYTDCAIPSSFVSQNASAPLQTSAAETHLTGGQ
jgi:hypothetical protein